MNSISPTSSLPATANWVSTLPLNHRLQQCARFGKALDIQEHCRGKIRCSFGIGTNLTNDTGFKPSNIVMKLTQCKMNVNQEWRECVKLSDDAGKHIGSEAEVRACLYDLRLGQQIEPLC